MPNRTSRAARLAALLSLLASAPAAAQDAGLDGGVPPSMDAGSDGGMDGGSGDGGTDGGTDAGPDAGDAGECSSSNPCPQPTAECRVAVCEDGVCRERDADDGTLCSGPEALPQCRQWECSAGACSEGYVDDGESCDDEDPCTSPDECRRGACEGTWNPEGTTSQACMCTWPEDPDGPGGFSETDLVTGNVTDLEVPLIDDVICAFLGRPGGDIEIEFERSGSGGELEHPDDDGLGYCTAHAERESSSSFEGMICGFGFFVRYSEEDSLTRTECAECPRWEEGAPRPEGMCLDGTGCDHNVHSRTFALGPLIADETEFSIGIPRTNFTIAAGVEWELSTGGEISMSWDRTENHGGPDRESVDCPECQTCYSRVIDFGPTFGFELQGTAQLGVAEGRVKAEGGVTVSVRKRDRRNSGSGSSFSGWSAVEPAPEGACSAESCWTGSVTGQVDLTFRVGLAGREALRNRQGLGRGRYSGVITFLHLACEGEYARPECDSPEWEGSWECTPRWTTSCEERTCEQRGYYCGQVRSECFDDLVIDCGECPATTDPYSEKVCISPRNRMPSRTGVRADRFSRACCEPRSCHSIYPDAPDSGSECVAPVPFSETHFGGPGFGPAGAPGDGETYVHCGQFHNGCTDAWYERSLNCGECANNPSAGITNNTCGGGGQPYGRCGCTPDTEADLCQPGPRGQAACGPRPDGCGAGLDCGACPEGQSCGDNGLCCGRTFLQTCGWEPGQPGWPTRVTGTPPRCGSVEPRGCPGVTYDCGEPPAGFVCDDGEWACPGGGTSCESDAFRCEQCAPTPIDADGPGAYTHPLTGTSTLCRSSDCR